ncbi:MAG TPA: hypothetical protein VGP93_00530, partial [Polyangiaceae bacterium]|nr:hypothetical protein [Polyangiaceae bacterium]
FVVYAFTAKVTYSASALVWLQAPKGKSALTMTEPLRAADQVKQVVLDAEFKGQPGLRSALDVTTLDGQAFSVTFEDSDRFRAQRIANLLAKRAAEALPQVMAPQLNAPDMAREREREKRVEDLMAFLAAHPEFTSIAAQGGASASAGASSAQKGKPVEDPALSALHKERSRLAQRLTELQGSNSLAWSDNPYNEGELWQSPTLLRRRLVEIDRTLDSRRKAMAHAETPEAKPNEVAPELRTEWTRLLAAVGRAPSNLAPTQASSAAISAKVVKPAGLPRWPVRPNRLLLVWLGALGGLAAGALVALKPSRSTRPVNHAPRAPWPVWSDASPRPPVPAIARSLPLPRARSPLATPPLALVRPWPRAVEPNASQRFARPSAMNRSGPRQGRGFSSQAIRAEQGMGKMIPIRRSDPARDPARQSRPRQTLMFGSVEGPLETSSALEAGEPQDRSVAITLRFREASTAEPGEALDRPLGILAHEPAGGFRPNPPLTAEARRKLASELYPLAAEHCLVLAVAGAPPRLKSRVAAELALALSERESARVLLLEGDFNRPLLHRLLGVHMPHAFGISRQLQARSEGKLFAGWSVVRCTPSLDVLAEGSMRTPGAVAGEQLASAIRELALHYTFIIIDAPALQAASDCRSLDAVCEGVILVHSREQTYELSRAAALFSKKRVWTTIQGE